MKRKGIRGWIRKVFGDIKVFRHPMYIAYDPGGYRVTGEDLREMLRWLEPGDVLLRRYYGYLDARFIPGRFTHAAVYCGELGDADRVHARERDFMPGPQMVIHALSPDVRVEDILTFSRCDEIAILRLPEVLRAGATVPQGGVPLKEFSVEERRIDECLQAGRIVPRDKAARQVVQAALRCVGLGYDYDFRMTSYRRVYCSELVYLCLKSVQRCLTVRPTLHRAWFMARNSVVPDDFLDCGLDLVWISRTVRKADAKLARRADAYAAAAADAAARAMAAAAVAAAGGIAAAAAGGRRDDEVEKRVVA